MMNKKLHYSLLIILGAAALTPTMIESRRNRQGSITQALQVTDKPFIHEEPLQLASIDKISFPLEKSRSELGGFVAQEKAADEEKTIMGQNSDYDLPFELQKKATQDLAKVEIQQQEEELISLQFEEADLQTFIQQISDIFKVTFISDDAIDPLPKGPADAPNKALKGNKISFKTVDPVTKQQAWNLFITFMNISGFGVIQQPDKSIYRIETIKSTQRAPIPTFIGVNSETLPENDEIIRYLYFMENASLDSMKSIIPSLQSTSAAAPIFLQDQKAFLLTDKSYNIKALMKIVKELDKITMPQAMSVLKLREADAVEVKKLYDDLTQQGEDRSPFKPFGARKASTAIYFPENARIIAEPRTNSLILLGPKDAIDKIEDFIVKHVDVALDQPYSPLYTYHLQYADAKTVADIMNKITAIGSNTEAGKTGGVRGKDKYLREMVFTHEPTTNKLIIRGDYNDYLFAKEIIAQLDEPQPQVAIEVLILSVRLQDEKQLGSQIRSKIPGLSGILGQNFAFQTSGNYAPGSPSGIITNPNGAGVDRLLGNLLQLVSNASVSNTIVTFGQDLFGVWGLFQALQTITNTQVISNPFLVAANKTPARISLGETRRVVSGVIVSGNSDNQNTFTDDKAELIVDIVPQINSDGMIVLKLRVELTEFTQPNDPNSGNKLTKIVDTQAIVSDREVLALGGLIRNTVTSGQSKTPILGDIPVIGWLFKNKSKSNDKNSLLILMSTKIIPPNATSDVNKFTQERLATYRSTMGEIAAEANPKDPIHRMFFSDRTEPGKDIGEFLFERHQKTRKAGRNRKRIDERALLELSKAAPAAPAPTVVAQTRPVTTIAAPSAQKSQKVRRSSLADYLSPSDSEKKV